MKCQKCHHNDVSDHEMSKVSCLKETRQLISRIRSIVEGGKLLRRGEQDWVGHPLRLLWPPR